MQVQLELLEVAYSADELSLPGCSLGLSETGSTIWQGPRVRALCCSAWSCHPRPSMRASLSQALQSLDVACRRQQSLNPALHSPGTL